MICDSTRRRDVWEPPKLTPLWDVARPPNIPERFWDTLPPWRRYLWVF